MLISLIIATLDAAAVLPGCLESIALQQLTDFEVVLADGLSKDDTVPIAESFRCRLPTLSISAQKDGGVYEAINRALAQARGEWILILGADDRLATVNVFSQLASTLRETEADIVYGDVMMMGPNQWVPPGAAYAGKVGIAFLAKHNICQQAVFYRRAALREDGGFNSKYRICADWVYLLGAYYRRPIKRIDMVISNYATAGLSSHAYDSALEKDRLDILGQTIARNPFDCELHSIRWEVRRCLTRAIESRALLRAACLSLACARLKFSKASAKKASGL